MLWDLLWVVSSKLLNSSSFPWPGPALDCVCPPPDYTRLTVLCFFLHRSRSSGGHRNYQITLTAPQYNRMLDRAVLLAVRYHLVVLHPLPRTINPLTSLFCFDLLPTYVTHSQSRLDAHAFPSHLLLPDLLTPDSRQLRTVSIASHHFGAILCQKCTFHDVFQSGLI
ncbi:hypothetical protein FA13DRAFT_1036925 [Coprinellus micaceus]|uniref:Secreted protein n=1 Tax=Coprinellus micaceus TaxID=71717 RepID=A0A4Y7SX25_COPMI|nr:hypothetical protein FA13DRAFT_1036925 [Coprinellus micaceus]